MYSVYCSLIQYNIVFFLYHNTHSQHLSEHIFVIYSFLFFMLSRVYALDFILFVAIFMHFLPMRMYADCLSSASQLFRLFCFRDLFCLLLLCFLLLWIFVSRAEFFFHNLKGDFAPELFFRLESEKSYTFLWLIFHSCESKREKKEKREKKWK